MSSHREAPEISKDPVADSTDTYAFVSPNPAEAGTVTLITNYIPLEDPAGGPNFYEFGEDVLYRINVDNNGDGWPDVMYEFTFPTEVRKVSFLYNNGPIERLESDNWNRRQHGTVVEVRGIDRTVLGDGLLLPPCNVGPRSTPNYADLAAAATYDLGDGIRFFAGQRLDGFYVDLGSVFDLGALRPFQNLHFIPLPEWPTDATPCAPSTSTRSPSRCRSSDSPATAACRPTRWRRRPSSACGRRRTARRDASGTRLRRPARARSPRSRASATRSSTRYSSRSA